MATTGMVLRDSTNKIGITDLLEDLTNTTSASTSSYSLMKKVRDINNAYSNFMMLARRAGGTFQVDDANWEGDATNADLVLKSNIVSGTQAYSVNVDETTGITGSVQAFSQIQDIYRVEIATSSAVTSWKTLCYYDEMQEPESSPLQQQATITGVPYRYYKSGSKIYLDPKPNYSATNGLYIYYTRTPAYFVGDDASNSNALKPGIPNQFHPYLAYLPAYQFCVSKSGDAGYARMAQGYLATVQRMEEEIKQFYSKRNKDERSQITTECISFR